MVKRMRHTWSRFASGFLLSAIQGRALRTDQDVRAALDVLATEADMVGRRTASAVFISTAIMQNGRLDGAVVLATQARMIWEIAAIYDQRPSLRRMAHLYSEVIATALLATSLEDVDFSEMVTPLAVSVVPSLKGALPGFQGISSLLVNSLANGAANAFLTLRVGAVAKHYCAATTPMTRESSAERLHPLL